MTDYKFEVDYLTAIECIAYGFRSVNKDEIEGLSENLKKVIIQNAQNLLHSKICEKKIHFSGVLGLLSYDEIPHPIVDDEYFRKHYVEYSKYYDAEIKNIEKSEIALQPWIDSENNFLIILLDINSDPLCPGTFMYGNIRFSLSEIKELTKKPLYKEFLPASQCNIGNTDEIEKLNKRIAELEKENAELKENQDETKVKSGRKIDLETKVYTLLVIKEFLKGNHLDETNFTNDFLNELIKSYQDIAYKHNELDVKLSKDGYNINGCSHSTLSRIIKDYKKIITKYKITL